MLNYGSEHAVDNESCDRNLEGFIRTVEEARSLPESAHLYVAPISDGLGIKEQPCDCNYHDD
ncbi:proline dehydrogenase [Bertholletia excelsa]